MTTKGEAIAIGIAQMNHVMMATIDHGVVAKVKRCIMERDLYPKRWGMGPTALAKKKLKADGKLDKYGRVNEKTPAKWTETYTDYGAPAGETAATSEAAAVSASSPVKKTEEASATPAPSKADAAQDKEDKKKRKSKHEGETAEEKAERKRLKKEKKEKKGKKGGDESD